MGLLNVRRLHTLTAIITVTGSRINTVAWRAVVDPNKSGALSATLEQRLIHLFGSGNMAVVPIA